MATAAAWANSNRLAGATRAGSPSPRPSVTANLALAAFLLAQVLDGILTYVGVMRYGLGVEANPVLTALMTHLGVGTGLLGAKLAAAFLGISLHIFASHRAVAALATFYFTLAIAPWTAILFL